jgi:hypothetical protein
MNDVLGVTAVIGIVAIVAIVFGFVFKARVGAKAIEIDTEPADNTSVSQPSKRRRKKAAGRKWPENQEQGERGG